MSGDAQFDRTDLRLLAEIQQHGRATNAELADQAGMVAAAPRAEGTPHLIAAAPPSGVGGAGWLAATAVAAALIALQGMASWRLTPRRARGAGHAHQRFSAEGFGDFPSPAHD